jgi:hypothetical protein
MYKGFTATIFTVLISLAIPEAAYASSVTVDGSYTISYTATKGNGPTDTGDLGTKVSGSTYDFTESLTPGVTTAQTNFISVAPAGSCGWGCGMANTATGTVSVVFTFSLPTGATGTFTETGAYMADYQNDTDSITWSSSNDPIKVTFANGDVLDLILYSASDWTMTPKISFDVTTPTATPLPPALSLFAGGLGIFGYLGARRKRKAATIAA